VALVVGTTGLDVAAREALERAARVVPVVASPNMSVGVNVLLALLRQAAEMLGQGYDFEIFEMHHRGKVDAPSGTALRMAEVVAEARGLELGQAARHGRSGALGPRGAAEIGIHAARGGDVVGDHLAVFAGPGERVELIHRAHGRDTFARGAVRAALWTAGRAPGLYGMGEVLARSDE
jgi:4-hydroxy-tetrahydrodipicolinate reductase